jgi:perosamine synthetase
MKIPFESEYRERFSRLLDEVFDSSFWSDGQFLRRFEEEFEVFTGLPSRGISSGGTGLLSILDYLNVCGKDVLVPANTFWATSRAVKMAGGNVVYVDCNREDLCLSLEDLKRKVTSDTKVVIVVHIGGHIAFEIEEIVAFCKDRSIVLVEDCAHVHGASWHGKTGGHYGFAGSYSFYATKTMPLGEGGMVVSRDKNFLSWLEKYRNYGKEIVDGQVTYPIKTGFNYRISEITAALGIIQLERLPKVLEWKRSLARKYDKIFQNRVKLPEGMVSGYYKYIVFGCPKLKSRTGQVFGKNDLGPVIENVKADVQNSLWITENHQCPPIFYGWEHADCDIEALKEKLF